MFNYLLWFEFVGDISIRLNLNIHFITNRNFYYDFTILLIDLTNLKNYSF